MKNRLCAMLLLAIFIQSCTTKKAEEKPLPQPDPSNAGLKLQENFGAIISADNLGRARHLAVDDDGVLYVKLRKAVKGNGILALRDNDDNGIIDEHEAFMPYGGTGIAYHDGYLYCSSDSNVYRYKLNPGELAPTSEMELIASGFPKQGPHAAKPITLDGAGHLYVTVGAPVNAGEKDAFSVESPGIDPSPYNVRQAGIWQFDANKPNQMQESAYHYGVGVRNAMALDWDFKTNSLYALSHGRDQLGGFWPKLYDEQQNADLPAEQFLKINKGQDYGWPYAYYDGFKKKQMMSPEFGGDGEKESDRGIEPALLGLPAHTAPNDLLFYTGDMFPDKYKNGAFVTLHGSWNRAPFPQQGYSVVFLPFKDGKPTGEIEEFATGFAGKEEVTAPTDAQYRPMGLAQAKDGSLFIVDSVKGRLWRIYYYQK